MRRTYFRDVTSHILLALVDYWRTKSGTKNGSLVHCWRNRWHGYAVNVFFPFIDHCLMPLNQRFPADKTDMSLTSKLMPLTIATMTSAEIARVFGW